MADGIFYRDSRQPWLIADTGNITLAATQKMLWTPGVGNPWNLPANYWTVGKTVKLTAMFKVSTGTAGNWVVGMAYGAADAPAAIVVSQSHAKIASVGPFVVFMEGYATCRSTGTAGTLNMWGTAVIPIDLALSTVGNVLPWPSAGTGVVSTIDTTVGTNGLFFTASNSAGTDTFAMIGMVMEALN
jgi:hypothetical protein